MEHLILLVITVAAIYYIYKSTFKDSGCNCSSNSCCSTKGKHSGQHNRD